MDFNMDQLVDGCLKEFYNNYDVNSYNNLNNDPYYCYNNPTPTTSYDYSVGYDSPCSNLWPTIESSMTDDLNCWTQEGQGPKVDSTDGAIYTLTVLNGTDQTGWFKQEETEEKIPNSDNPSSAHRIPAKKYTKRSKSTTPTASSSSGVRKERSRHYCSICSKGFKDKYSVNVHMRTHTGEKPFTCSLCAKSFRQKAHLAKHYQTHLAQPKNGLSTSKSAKNLIPSR